MEVLTFVVLILFGFVAYWIRSKNRFSYGVIEVIAAVGLMIISVFHPEPGHLLVSDGSAFGRFLSAGLAYVAAIYLMVRGLDNMDSDLPTAWRSRWDRLFPKKPT